MAKRSRLRRAGAAFATALPDLLLDSAGVAGAALIAYGAWLIYAPAGFISAGVLLLVGVLFSARGRTGASNPSPTEAQSVSHLI
jgi:membrane-bound ClpP family serine protease